MTPLFILAAGFFCAAFPQIIAIRERRQALSLLDGILVWAGALAMFFAIGAFAFQWWAENIAR